MIRKIVKILRKTIVILLCITVLWLRGYALYQSYRSLSDTQLQKKRSSVHDRVVSNTIDIDGRSLHYLDIWDVEKPVMVLIHGAPGSISDRSRVMGNQEIYDIYRIIAVDRLWYGRSGIGSPVTSIQTQSESIFALLDMLDIQKAAVLWHSYGGPIVAKMLMEWWDRLVWWLIFAGAVDPEHEKVFPISYYIDWLPMKLLMWPMLWSANREKLTHVSELEKLDNWGQIDLPVRVVHGTADSLVPYINALYMQEKVSEEYFSLRTLEWADHPIHFSMPEMIVEEMMNFRRSFE